jgi:hypothetical protein
MIGTVLAGALPMLRAQAESLMLDTCTVCPVTGVNESTGAPTLGVAIYGPSIAPHYGKCKFKDPSTKATTAQAGGATYTVQSPEVHFPAGGLTPVVGLVVTGVSSATSTLVIGRQVRVTGRPLGSQTTALRLPVEEIV